jgi:hypothetical protein
MTDQNPDSATPTSPDAAPAKPHGDALLDQSGSRHGTPPPESAATPDDGTADDDDAR